MAQALRVLVLLGLLLFAAGEAGAQGVRTEVVTIQVNGTTPLGTRVLGTIVVNRSCAATVTADVTFNGTVNGRPARFSGKVIERWLGPGHEQVEVIATDLRGLVLGKSALRTFTLLQSGPNLVLIDGLPVAIDGTLAPPCSGRLSYLVTNAGQQSLPIARLPNTAGAPPAANLVLLSLALLGLAVQLAPLARQSGTR